MKMFDSIYGEFVHKDWVQPIIVTPVMQRLRWIALSNIPSLTYPMISGVSRYAHSIGVSHLADILSDSLNLNETDRKNLVCAGLLHDAGMPPLGHLTEEVLASLNIDFDHENSLRIILLEEGRRFSLMPDGEKVGLTEAINRIHADSRQIFDAIIGNGRLGQYIASSMDIDNIDNVIRLYRIIFPNQEGYNPELITRGYFVHSSNAQEFKDKWDLIREKLYTKLMFSIDDFQQKATMKRMIKAYFLSKLKDKEGDTNKVVDRIRFINDSQFLGEILKCISDTNEHCSFYSGRHDSLVIYGWVEEIDKPGLIELRDKMTKGNYYLDYIPDKRFKGKSLPNKKGALVGLFSFGKTNKTSDGKAKERLLELMPNFLESYTPAREIDSNQLSFI